MRPTITTYDYDLRLRPTITTYGLPEMTYGPGNRLATSNPSASSGQGGQTVQFDTDGNMTHGPLSGTLDNFVYDARSRLVQAGTTQYLYDAESQRIGVDDTRFVINSQPALSQVLVKTAADGGKTFYVYGLGLIGEESAAGYKAYHFDFRGSTVALSDASGAVLERYRYSAYGALLAGDVSVTPFLFNGMYGVMTDGNGLYHMRARFYSAEIRRFLNRDVVVGDVARGQSLNRFAFVRGKPISLADPFGLKDYTIEELASKVKFYNSTSELENVNEGIAEYTGEFSGNKDSILEALLKYSQSPVGQRVIDVLMNSNKFLNIIYNPGAAKALHDRMYIDGEPRQHPRLGAFQKYDMRNLFDVNSNGYNF
jgi:RHS repeat-associated protein